MQETVLIIGGDSFTGIALRQYLETKRYNVFITFNNSEYPQNDFSFHCDIKSEEQINEILKKVNPDYIIHLAGLSFVDESNSARFYEVNVLGTENLLRSIAKNCSKTKKTVIASSATVYGNQFSEVLDENMCPKPVNHYGISKLGVEMVAGTYFDKLNILVTRPFNYTGPGQSEKFLIPKIIKHFKEDKKNIELGNIDVAREFNDIRDVVAIYERLMVSEAHSEIVNICSARAIKLLEIIKIMNALAGYEIKVEVNPLFVRKNEIQSLTGSTQKLSSLIKLDFKYSIEDTLTEMYTH